MGWLVLLQLKEGQQQQQQQGRGHTLRVHCLRCRQWLGVVWGYCSS
jgi:hypothetical protein